MTTGRNEPCPCGSGKKFKKCCINKKPRINSVKANFEEPTALNKLLYYPKCGRVEFYYDDEKKAPITASSDLTYERNKGPKILSSVVADPEDLISHPNLNLLRFKHIVAIDTNTKTTKLGTACVMAAVHAFPYIAGERMEIASAHRSAFEFWNPTSAPERIGWKIVLESIEAKPQYQKGDTFGVIVDSELGLLDEFNSKNQPILGDYFLPEQVTLMYGSSDKKNDSILNGMIHLADQISNTIHRQMKAINHRKSGSDGCQYYTDGRQWDNIPVDV